jgi:hypothetical protein
MGNYKVEHEISEDIKLSYPESHISTDYDLLWELIIGQKKRVLGWVLYKEFAESGNKIWDPIEIRGPFENEEPNNFHVGSRGRTYSGVERNRATFVDLCTMFSIHFIAPPIVWPNNVHKLFPEEQIELISDGYHTFKELYEFRAYYNAAFVVALWTQYDWMLAQKIVGQDRVPNIHKSKKHHDGELCFGGKYFIVVADIPIGGVISNHYPMELWDIFQIPEKEVSDIPYDGHTPKDVIKRLESFLTCHDFKHKEIQSRFAYPSKPDESFPDVARLNFLHPEAPALLRPTFKFPEEEMRKALAAAIKEHPAHENNFYRPAAAQNEAVEAKVAKAEALREWAQLAILNENSKPVRLSAAELERIKIDIITAGSKTELEVYRDLIKSLKSDITKPLAEEPSSKVETNGDNLSAAFYKADEVGPQGGKSDINFTLSKKRSDILLAVNDLQLNDLQRGGGLSTAEFFDLITRVYKARAFEELNAIDGEVKKLAGKRMTSALSDMTISDPPPVSVAVKTDMIYKDMHQLHKDLLERLNQIERGVITLSVRVGEVLKDYHSPEKAAKLEDVAAMDTLRHLDIKDASSDRNWTTQINSLVKGVEEKTGEEIDFVSKPHIKETKDERPFNPAVVGLFNQYLPKEIAPLAIEAHKDLADKIAKHRPQDLSSFCSAVPDNLYDALAYVSFVADAPFATGFRKLYKAIRNNKTTATPKQLIECFPEVYKSE